MLRSDLTVAAKQYAQENVDSGTPLLNAGADYDKCIDAAIVEFSQDRARVWIKDYTVVTAGFLFTLFNSANTSGILQALGIKSWVDGFSDVVRVFYPYLAANQADDEMDPNLWRLRDDIDGSSNPITVLEFLGATPNPTEVIRLFYTTPHLVDANDPTKTTVRAGDEEPFRILTAAIICEQAAIRYAQNTGNSNLAADTVDRRSQSDVMKSRAKDLRNRYNAAIGKGKQDDVAQSAASAWKDLDVGTSHRRGMLWHPSGNR